MKNLILKYGSLENAINMFVFKYAKSLDEKCYNDALNKLSLEERLRRIEELLYNAKPPKDNI